MNESRGASWWLGSSLKLCEPEATQLSGRIAHLITHARAGRIAHRDARGRCRPRPPLAPLPRARQEEGGSGWCCRRTPALPLHGYGEEEEEEEPGGGRKLRGRRRQKRGDGVMRTCLA